MKKFLKSSDVVLVNGGYLSTKEGETPIFNKDFVKAQEHAEYITTFARLAEGKDFKGKKADSISDLRSAVKAELATKAKTYLEAPAKIDKPVTKSLADEAMAFMKWEEKSSKVEKVNAFLQQFNILNEFETYGLFFKEDIVKLNKIYTMAEVIASVEKVIDLLD